MTPDESTNRELLPALPYDSWKDTLATLHMWTQITGKVRLKLSPLVNHWWNVPFYLSARGMTTAAMPYQRGTVEVQFDFIDHKLLIATNDGRIATIPLAPQTVAQFYDRFMTTLAELGVDVAVWTTPCEIPDPIPFERDNVHKSYDPEAVHKFWTILAWVDQVFKEFRAGFIGKVSPVHFFWGSFDLAVSRFSGRLAPPREGPRFMRDAYSHEVISHGFWPGSGMVLEPAFYAYAVPEPTGLKDATLQPSTAYYHREMGEFILPYEAVRTAPDPAAEIQAFVDSTYDRAATLAGWDRGALERTAAAV